MGRGRKSLGDLSVSDELLKQLFKKHRTVHEVVRALHTSSPRLNRTVRNRFGMSVREFKKGIDIPIRPEKILKIKAVLKLYRKLWTYNRIGKKYGVCHERIRHILNQAEKLGLVNLSEEVKKVSRRRSEIYWGIPKKRLEAVLRKSISLTAAAKVFGKKAWELKCAIRLYGIEKDVRTWTRKNREADYKALYDKIVKRLGHHPTATELHNPYNGTGLSIKLYGWIWHRHGGIHKFRAKFFPDVDFGKHYHTSPYYLNR